MAIDVTREELVSLRAAQELLPMKPGGKPTHIQTIRRWVSVGVRGVKLETVRVGGSVCTSREAIARFVAGLNGPGAADGMREQAARMRQAGARKKLAAMGV